MYPGAYLGADHDVQYDELWNAAHIKLTVKVVERYESIERAV